jgi:hypothetical protein
MTGKERRMSNQVEGEEYKGDSKIDVSKASIDQSCMIKHVRGEQEEHCCKP